MCVVAKVPSLFRPLCQTLILVQVYTHRHFITKLMIIIHTYKFTLVDKAVHGTDGCCLLRRTPFSYVVCVPTRSLVTTVIDWSGSDLASEAYAGMVSCGKGLSCAHHLGKALCKAAY